MMNCKNKIDTVIFDIGNVLAGFSYREYFESFGYDEDTVDRMIAASVKSPAWAEFDLGNLSVEEIVELFIANAPDLAMQFKEVTRDIHDLITHKDYSIGWIEDLRSRGYRTLYLSNFSYKGLADCQDALDFIQHMDGGIYSCDMHIIKPDKRLYQLLIDRYSLDPVRCVFIDDTPVNVEAAMGLGMQGIVFKSYEQGSAELDRILKDRIAL